MQEFKNILASPTNVERLILAGIGLLQGVTAWLVVRIEPQEPIEKSFLFGLLAWVLSSGLLYQFASSGRERMRLTTIVMWFSNCRPRDQPTKATTFDLSPGRLPQRSPYISSCRTYKSFNGKAGRYFLTRTCIDIVSLLEAGRRIRCVS